MGTWIQRGSANKHLLSKEHNRLLQLINSTPRTDTGAAAQLLATYTHADLATIAPNPVLPTGASTRVNFGFSSNTLDTSTHADVDPFSDLPPLIPANVEPLESIHSSFITEREHLHRQCELIFMQAEQEDLLGTSAIEDDNTMTNILVDEFHHMGKFVIQFIHIKILIFITTI